jgi:HlyD family secretion protein
MPQATRNLIVVAFVLAAGSAVAFAFRSRHDSSSHTDPAKTTAAQQESRTRKTVAALGRLEPQGGVIAVGGTAGERIDRLLVAEGDQVKKGQELAFLGSYPLRISERQLAEIQVAEAKARSQAEQSYGAALLAEAQTALDQLEFAELDAQSLRAKIEAAELSSRIAARDLERLTAAGDVVSEQERDHQQLVAEQAKAELNSSRAQLAKLEASREVHQREATARLETAKANQLRLQAAIQLESLEKGLATATQKVELAVVRAPRDGRVLRIVTQAGETIGPRPILQLGDIEHMYATAEIYETDVRFVHPGQQATVTSDALTEPLRGTIESIGTTVAKNEVMSLDPTAAADARVVLARIRLDDSQEAAGLVDLQVDVVIDTALPAGAAHASAKERD